MKQCTKCKNWKYIEDFSYDKSRKDNKNPQCKECNNQRREKWREKNDEYEKARNKQYRDKNREYLKKIGKQYRENNCENEKTRSKQYSKRPLLYSSNSKWKRDIELYEEIRESKNGNIECKCTYCGGWFEPSAMEIKGRLQSINNLSYGERRLYCSNNCKKNCPTFKQVSYFKDQKPATSREVQPELRQLVFERDNYTCQKCNIHRDNLEVGIHCHHKEGILWEPLQSADMDMCVTLCEDCHKEVHGIDGCGYQDMKCA